MRIKEMGYVKKNSLDSEIKNFAEKLEQPSRKGFISIPLLSLMLEDAEVGEVPVNAAEVKRGRMPQESILKKKEEATRLVGQEDFTDEEMTKIKKVMKKVNEFIHQDEMEFNEPFEEFDEDRTGLLLVEDFE